MTPPSPTDPLPAVRDDLAEVELDGERVVYDPVRRRVHRLDPVGALVWSLLDGSGTVGQLVGDLAAAFERSEDTVLADVGALLRWAADEQLLAGAAVEPWPGGADAAVTPPDT